MPNYWRVPARPAYTLFSMAERSILASGLSSGDDLSFGDDYRGINRMASNLPKNLVLGSFGVAGLVALLAILDIVTAMPFAGSMTMDILFILSAAVVGYLAWDAYSDLA